MARLIIRGEGEEQIDPLIEYFERLIKPQFIAPKAKLICWEALSRDEGQIAKIQFQIVPAHQEEGISSLARIGHCQTGALTPDQAGVIPFMEASGRYAQQGYIQPGQISCPDMRGDHAKMLGADCAEVC